MKEQGVTNLKLTICYLIFLTIVLVGAISSRSAHAGNDKTAEFTNGRKCGDCHKEIYNYWSKSLHRHSVDDPVFETAYLEAYKKTEGEARYLCPRCHAPTTQLTGDYALNSELSKEGVTCDFCHSIKSVNLDSSGPTFILDVGKVKRGPLLPSQKLFSDHEVKYSPLHTKSELCAGCHEYRNERGVLLLGTYSEWKESSYAREGKQCQFCHMAEVSGEIAVTESGEGKEGSTINRHDVSGGHSIPLLKKAVEVRIADVTRDGNRVKVSVDITNAGSGHMVPTGIPSRMLVLNVYLKTDRGLVLSNRKIYKKTLLDEEGNELTRDSDIFIKSAEVTSDNRLAPGETNREIFMFVIPRGAPVEAKAAVSYLYKPILLQEGRMEVEMASDSTRVSKNK